MAATALMIDYVLNVAVAISAGAAVLVSAVPALHPYTLPLCLGILMLITIANLRGTPDAGRLFARSEEHTSELQSLMRISYAVFCLKQTNYNNNLNHQKPTPHRLTL